MTTTDHPPEPTRDRPSSRNLRQARGGVLVLGGGFAGASVARALGRAGATVVNPTTFMLYTPILPEAASGTLEPRRAAVGIRAMCPHAELLVGRVSGIDTERRVVRVETDVGGCDVAYEQLVIALGAIASVPAVPGLHAHALGLKDLADAIALRNHVLHQLDLADAEPADAARHLSFVFAGAGHAGVEAIAEMHELVQEAIKRHPRLRETPQHWLLLDRGDHILGQTPRRLGAYVERELTRRGIDIRTRTALVGVDGDHARLSDGTTVDTRTVVWTAGVRANPLLSRLGLPVDDRGRVLVDECLRVHGMPDVWALGDGAAVPNAATPGVLDPPTCQHALRQARRLAQNLQRPARRYRYKTRGQVASLGRHHGIAVVFGISLSGFVGWLMARVYHLLQIPGRSLRARVASEWALAQLFQRDTTELTTLNGIGTTELARQLHV